MKRSFEEVEELTVGKDAGACNKIAKAEDRMSPSDRPTFEVTIPTKGLHASFSKFLNDIVLATTTVDTGPVKDAEPLSLEEMWFEEGTSGSETEGLSSDHEDDYAEYKFHH